MSYNKGILRGKYMELAIRNKWISLRGSSVVKDLNEKDVLKVRGKFWTFTRKKFIQTLDGETKFIVRNKFWTLFIHRAFVMDPNGKIVARIRRKFWSVHDRYFIQSDLGELEICGNILCYNYQIKLDGKEIGHVSRKISLRDSFVLTIDDSYDYYFFVALVIAIDNITDQRAQESASVSYSN